MISFTAFICLQLADDYRAVFGDLSVASLEESMERLHRKVKNCRKMKNQASDMKNQLWANQGIARSVCHNVTDGDISAGTGNLPFTIVPVLIWRSTRKPTLAQFSWYLSSIYISYCYKLLAYIVIHIKLTYNLI